MGNELELLIESISTHAMVTTFSNEVEIVNQPTLKYFGKTLEEFKRWKLSDVVHPDDLQNTIAAQRKGVETGGPYSVERRHRRADGAYRWFNALCLPMLDADGRIVRWVHLITDIDDQKRAVEALRASETNLRQIVDNVPGFLCTFSPAGGMDLVNRQMLEYFGKTLDELNNWELNDTVHPDDLLRVTPIVKNSFTTGARFEDELRYRRADGVHRWCHVEIVPMRDASGTVTSWYGLITDIEDRKRTEQELQRLESELAHASRVTTLGVLTASIAHEVSQPLTGISTNLDTCSRMLSADPPNVEGARETVGRASRDVNRAIEVVARLRALFSNKEPRAEPLDLNETALEVIALSLGRLQRDGVVLRQELADDLPAVTGDRVQLQQVILNLVLNASDAMSDVYDRPRQLVIRTSRAGHGVQLTVEDAGIGIQPEVAAKLFHPFYTTKASGMGIGLSVSRSIIERHRGRIWAEPNDGPGVSLSFAIPGRAEGVGEPAQ